MPKSYKGLKKFKKVELLNFYISSSKKLTVICCSKITDLKYYTHLMQNLNICYKYICYPE